jgi:hypothetical protein
MNRTPKPPTRGLEPVSTGRSGNNPLSSIFGNPSIVSSRTMFTTQDQTHQAGFIPGIAVALQGNVRVSTNTDPNNNHNTTNQSDEKNNRLRGHYSNRDPRQR